MSHALRFHRELYAGEALDEALKLYSRFATFEQREEPEHWVITLSAKSESREKKIACELANYALGLSIERARRGSR